MMPDSTLHLAELEEQHAFKVVDVPYEKAISAGKNTYVYDAHTYHTKVPPQGIEPLIAYYTNPGDTVLDPFCGSGMTGIAAARLGRRALLSDLSPAATFIARNFNSPIDARVYKQAVHALLESSRALEEQLYSTRCRDCGSATPLLYTVWSYGMLCSKCDQEFVLWDVARDERPRVRDSKILAEFPCPHCHQIIKKRALKRTKRVPVAVGYKCCSRGLKESNAPLEAADFAALERIETEWASTDLWHPTAPFPDGINTRQPRAAGIERIDQAYTTRALWAMSHLWELASQWPDEPVREKLLWTLTSLYQRVTVFSEFRFWGGSGNMANYNVPAIMNEQNVFRTFARKANTISWYFQSTDAKEWSVEVETKSSCDLSHISNGSIDYIFTDPPFGGYINYSEMNFLWESWLKKSTCVADEAIINSVQGKNLSNYQDLLLKSFKEICRVLKDHSWLTVMFHNSSEHVWNALHSALTQSGFSIEGKQIFDKEHGTFKQFVSENSVGYDLVLHCRKAGFVSESVTRPAIEVEPWLRNRLKNLEGNYTIHYLHVNRADEFNFRRLYADWLTQSTGNTPITLDFEKFSTLVSQIIQELPTLDTEDCQPQLELNF